MTDTSVLEHPQVVEGVTFPIVELPEEDTQFSIALRRISSQDCPEDPQSAVAPFNSAF